MKKQKSAKQLILDTLKEKACLKQKVFKQTISVFHDFKKEAEKLTEELEIEMGKVDKDVIINL